MSRADKRLSYVGLITTVCLLMLFLCGKSAAAGADGNLLASVAEWQSSSWRNGAEIALDDTVRFDGRPSWRLHSTTPNDLRVTKSVRVEAGRYYRFSAAVKTENISGPVGANLSVYGSYDYSRRTLTGDNGWTRLTQVFRALDDGQVDFALRLGYWNATASGTAWFSDARLEVLDDWMGDYQAIEKGPADPTYSSGALRYFAFLLFVPFLYGYLALLRQQRLIPSAGTLSKWFALQLTALLSLALLVRLVFAGYMGFIPQLELYQAWALNLAGSPTAFSDNLPYLAELGGPLWLYWLGVVGSVVQANMLEADPLFTLLIKLPGIVAELVLIYLLLRRLAGRLPVTQFWWQAGFVALNPALIMVTAFWGEPVAIAVLGLLLALVWLQGDRPLGAALAFAGAAAAHWLSILLLPLMLLLLKGRPRWEVGRFCLVLAGGMALFYLPSAGLCSGSVTAADLPQRFAHAVPPSYTLPGFMTHVDAGFAWLAMILMAALGVVAGLRVKEQSRPSPPWRGQQWLFSGALLGALLLPWAQDLMLYLAVAVLVPLLACGRYFRWAFLLLSVLLFVKQVVLFSVVVLAGASVANAGVMAWLVPAVLLAVAAAGMAHSLGDRYPTLVRRVQGWGRPILSLDSETGIATPFAMRRRDYAALFVIWLAAFALLLTNIGAHVFPSQGYRVAEGGDAFELLLDSPQRIKQVRAYTGSNGSGVLRFEGWNGEKWLPLWRQESGRLRYHGDTEYRSTYKLLRKTINSRKAVQRLRVTIEGAGFDLNEIALLGFDYQPLIPAQLVLAGGEVLAAHEHPLFDEQTKIGRPIDQRAMTVWDEVFYTRSAHDLIEGQVPFEKSHPPLGKSLIALGIRLFDMTPLGWRVVDAFFVSLLPLLLFVGGRWLTGRRVGAYVAAILAVFEPMFFIHGRWANIDAFLVLFLTASCLVFYRWYSLGQGRIARNNVGWLLAGGALFSLALAIKWSALFTGFAIFVLFVIAKGFEWARARSAPRKFSLDVGWWGLSLVVLPLLVYYLSHAEFVQTVPGQPHILSVAGLQAFVDQQLYVWGFHSGKHEDHGAASLFLTWPFMWQPVAMFSSGAVAEGMRASLNMLGNPLIWWPGFIAMLGMAWVALAGRNKVAVFLAGLYFLQCLPWLLIGRTTFLYHYFEFLPYVILAIAYGVSRLDFHKTWSKVALGGYLAAVALAFAAYYPLLTATPVPIEYVDALRIFPSWSVL